MWFQNRRTKHKRVQQEGEEPSSAGKKSGSGENAMSDDESDIDLEMSDEDDYMHNPSATNGMMYSSH